MVECGSFHHVTYLDDGFNGPNDQRGPPAFAEPRGDPDWPTRAVPGRSEKTRAQRPVKGTSQSGRPNSNMAVFFFSVRMATKGKRDGSDPPSSGPTVSAYPAVQRKIMDQTPMRR